jgi:hypothetical protein
MYLFSTKNLKIYVTELYLRLVVSRRTADGGKNPPVGEYTPVYCMVAWFMPVVCWSAMRTQVQGERRETSLLHTHSAQIYVWPLLHLK